MMINSKECTEVYEFLRYMDKADVMKIPQDILLYIKENRDEEYKTRIKKEELFNFNNISENSLNFLIYLDQTFLMSDNEKQIQFNDGNHFFIDKGSSNQEDSNTLVELKKSNKIFELFKKIFKLKQQ